MTTKSRTGLLLGFTAVMMTATLSGCFVETSSGGPRPPTTTCLENRYFQVYWSVADNISAPPYTCGQTPAFSSVRLLTNSGSFEVGKQCNFDLYRGEAYSWVGSTADASMDDRMVPGTYIISADLMAADGVTSLSSAPGAGSQYQIQSCDPVSAAFVFDLNF